MVEHTLTNLWNTNVMRFTQETSWTSVSDIGLARSLSFSSIPPAAAALLYGGWILCLYFVGICKFLKFYHSWCFSPYQFGCVKKFRSNSVYTYRMEEEDHWWTFAFSNPQHFICPFCKNIWKFFSFKLPT